MMSECNLKMSVNLKTKPDRQNEAAVIMLSASLFHVYISSEAPTCVSGVLGATHVEIEHHLEMGRKLLAAGQLAEALSHYHSAVGKVTHTHTDTHFILADIFSLCLCSSNAYPLSILQYRQERFVFVQKE